jgi:uncharacterized protein YbjT (DUF2867 family)
MKINAILFGATGMVGEGVLIEALDHHQIESVLVIGRRPCKITHSKLKELIQRDFYDFSAIEAPLKGYDACFFCLGVSSVGMSEQDYRRVTYDLTMQAAATLSKLNPEMIFCYISGTGTDSTEKGRSMWARVKGKTENDLARLPFKAVYSFRPGLMKPNTGQKNVKTVFRILGSMYPLWKLLFPLYVCTLQELGRAMINAVAVGSSKRILENSDIRELANANSNTGP